MTQAQEKSETLREGLLTIAELASKHNLPESTARYYCKQFMDYLPHTGQGKRRRFLPQAEAVFDLAVAEMKKRKSAASVKAVLDSRFGSAAKESQNNEPAANAVAAMTPQAGERVLHLLEQGVQALQSIAAALNEKPAARQDTLPAAAPDLPENLENDLAEMKESLAELHKLQDQAETLHQQDLEQLRKWLGHLAAEQAKQSGQG